MDARGGRGTSGAARLENGQTFDRPEIKTDRVSNSQNLREAHELCHEEWLKEDLAQAKSEDAPLWDGKAKLRARIALPDESAIFSEAKNMGQPSDGLMLVYLVELDGNETDEQTVHRPEPDLPDSAEGGI